ncbi:type II secretion system minor pseudopilin GspK [Legionella impletisoli]|uniref:Type II secretion system protein K n=1 Tax=Legionella impletisoli TaxID=343510 RepID=A0A917JLW5_9GAMM|nr:type II secretion system minor pseudopilin GspK [Legionella impletisoli]GGI76734.1 type II secretion system protein K [Legionella impletisoli]
MGLKFKSRGSALLTALFIMTLVAIAVTAMSTRLHLDIYRTRLTITSDKLYLASQGVTFWAMNLLSNPEFNKPLPETIEYPNRYENLYPQIRTTGKLIDLQARFNLNNLQDKRYEITFNQLLEQILPSMNSNERKSQVLATAHWVTPYKPDQGTDRLLSIYKQNKPPYLPSHQPMKSISEFRLIQSVSAQDYLLLSPYITALPEITSININTASKPVLMALGNGLTENQVNDLKMILGEGLLDLKAVSKQIEKLNIPPEQITTESMYYLSEAVTRSEHLSLINYTILKRTKDEKGNVTISVELESLNTL